MTPETTPDQSTLAARLRELVTLAWNSGDIDTLLQAADALDATCQTCRFNVDARNGVSLNGQYRTLCAHPKMGEANKGAYGMVPWPFGCNLHAPAPAHGTEGGETR